MVPTLRVNLPSKKHKQTSHKTHTSVLLFDVRNGYWSDGQFQPLVVKHCDNLARSQHQIVFTELANPKPLCQLLTMCRQWNIYIAGAFLMVAVTTAGLAMTKLKHMHCMLLTATIGGRHQNYELLPRLRLPCKSSHRVVMAVLHFLAQVSHLQRAMLSF